MTSVSVLRGAAARGASSRLLLCYYPFSGLGSPSSGARLAEGVTVASAAALFSNATAHSTESFATLPKVGQITLPVGS
eukprot:scaffold147225_cov36-Prasinocladus_malaysianus.AAC.2